MDICHIWAICTHPREHYSFDPPYEPFLLSSYSEYYPEDLAVGMSEFPRHWEIDFGNSFLYYKELIGEYQSNV